MKKIFSFLIALALSGSAIVYAGENPVFAKKIEEAFQKNFPNASTLDWE